MQAISASQEHGKRANAERSFRERCSSHARFSDQHFGLGKGRERAPAIFREIPVFRVAITALVSAEMRREIEAEAIVPDEK